MCPLVRESRAPGVHIDEWGRFVSQSPIHPGEAFMQAEFMWSQITEPCSECSRTTSKGSGGVGCGGGGGVLKQCAFVWDCVVLHKIVPDDNFLWEVFHACTSVAVPITQWHWKCKTAIACFQILIRSCPNFVWLLHTRITSYTVCFLTLACFEKHNPLSNLKSYVFSVLGYNLTPSLPWCCSKMANENAKFETLKPFCLLFLTGMWKDFHQNI